MIVRRSAKLEHPDPLGHLFTCLYLSTSLCSIVMFIEFLEITNRHKDKNTKKTMKGLQQSSESTEIFLPLRNKACISNSKIRTA